MPPFRQETLANALTVEFFDHSNRYFGDYWRLEVEVRCRVPLSLAGLPPEEEASARTLLGEAVDFARKLERMGVPSAERDAVRAEMAASFLGTSRSYLEHPDFPARLVRSRLAEAKRPRRPWLVK